MQSSARVFDSRDVGTALKADSTTNVTIAGRAGVPVDASAAVVNLTATGASSESYLSAWPAGAARPAASNVNPVAGRTVANLAVVPIGAGGAISLYNHAGTVDAIVDVLGWLDATGGVTLAPSTRLLDTRPTATPLGPDAIAEIGVAVPAVAGATAPVGATVPTPSRGVSTGDVGVIVNITAAEASAATYLTVWPSGGARPATSTLNPSPGPAQANTVLLGIGSLAAGGGSIALANHSGRVHVIVDLLGVLSPVAGFHALAPTRLLDTRPPDVHHAFPVSLAASPPPSYVRDHHDYPATDIFAACGTPVLAPVDGTIVHVRRIDRYDPAVGNPATLGGRSIAIVGDDGVRYYGSHLDTFVDGIAVGVRVAAGQPLATVGKTGDAGACHLHFGLSPLCPSVEWSVRRGVIWPWPYLDSWRVGGNLSPVPEIASWFGAHGNACAAASALATAPDSEDPAAPAAAALRYGAR